MIEDDDELAELRSLLEALRSGRITMRERNRDVTRREHDMLEREILRLDLILSRARRRQHDAETRSRA